MVRPSSHSGMVTSTLLLCLLLPGHVEAASSPARAMRCPNQGYTIVIPAGFVPTGHSVCTDSQFRNYDASVEFGLHVEAASGRDPATIAFDDAGGTIGGAESNGIFLAGGVKFYVYDALGDTNFTTGAIGYGAWAVGMANGRVYTFHIYLSNKDDPNTQHRLQVTQNALRSIHFVGRVPDGGPRLAIRVWVDPGTMPYNAYPTLYARTQQGSTCSADVLYSTGRHPTSFTGYAQTVPPGGRVSWGWHEETKGYGGTATVSCTYRGATGVASAGFAVTH